MVLSLLALLIFVSASTNGCSLSESSSKSMATIGSKTSSFSTVLAPPTASCDSSVGSGFIHEREFTFKYLSNTKDWIKVDVYINNGDANAEDNNASDCNDKAMSARLGQDTIGSSAEESSSVHSSHYSAGPQFYTGSNLPYTYDSKISDGFRNDFIAGVSDSPCSSSDDEKTLSLPLLASTQTLRMPIASVSSSAAAVTTSSDYDFDYYTLPSTIDWVSEVSTTVTPTWLPCSRTSLSPAAPTSGSSLNILSPKNSVF